MPRSVGIGHQNFEQMITNDLFYIDKTSFIKEWWEYGDAVTLITRPRRFGKTLNLSMTEQFFSTEYAGRKDLFQDLTIWKEEKYRNLQGTYPVIFLSFSKVKEINFTNTRRRICRIIKTLYNHYQIKFKRITTSHKESRITIVPQSFKLPYSQAYNQNNNNCKLIII